MGPLQCRFAKTLRTNYPFVEATVMTARDRNPDLVDRHFEQVLGWCVAAFGDDAPDEMARGLALFTLQVNKEQLLYEARGRYRYSRFEDVNALTYQDHEYMRSYYWGVLAILFCWPHYVDALDMYMNRFVPQICGTKLVEFAPGHGAWGLMAASLAADLEVDVWDISPQSMTFAGPLARAAGTGDHYHWHLGDVTALPSTSEGRCDALVSNFLLEHLEEPRRAFESALSSLRPSGVAFISLALTAAQIDHIYEFVDEDEAVAMAESVGFIVRESMLAQPDRTVPSSMRVPRIQSLMLQKP